MPLFKARIEILIEAETYAEACDGIAEPMRELLTTAFLDWQYSDHGCPERTTGDEFADYVADKAAHAGD